MNGSNSSPPAEVLSPADAKLAANRELLIDANARGGAAKIRAYAQMSGPGWLQSAITLGGGSLSGALFLGVLGGYSLLWIQLLAIVMGVIMLSAISYVTLSTGKRPFQAINEHINPALGWSWALATCAANLLWCMPQFGLAYAALNKNLLGQSLGDSTGSKLGVSAVILAGTLTVVYMNSRGGKSAKAFDWFLKGMVGLVVISFFGVVVYLASTIGLPWGEIFGGFIPDLGQASEPAGDLASMVQQVPAEHRAFWADRITGQQRAVMIGAAATAVGINMTFLLPYSMLNRGWDRHFRGAARFDLATGMAIPYILVTTCVVIAAATQFHAKPDPTLLTNDPAIIVQSDSWNQAKLSLLPRAEREYENHEKVDGMPAFEDLPESEQIKLVAALPDADKKLAAAVLKRDAFQLSTSLAPLLGAGMANFVFGLGVLAMALSTIIILMLINGYVLSEMLGKKQGGKVHMIGCLAAGIAGAIWPLVWDGPAKFWLAILVSAFGMMLLPIAYVTFFCMLNSKSLMGDDKPKGKTLLTWNTLMGFSVLGAFAAAATAVWDKASHPVGGPVVIGLLVVLVAAVTLGFLRKRGRA